MRSQKWTHNAYTESAATPILKHFRYCKWAVIITDVSRIPGRTRVSWFIRILWRPKFFIYFMDHGIMVFCPYIIFVVLMFNTMTEIIFKKCKTVTWYLYWLRYNLRVEQTIIIITVKFIPTRLAKMTYKFCCSCCCCCKHIALLYNIIINDYIKLQEIG